jgi:DUF2892 family protein
MNTTGRPPVRLTTQPPRGATSGIADSALRRQPRFSVNITPVERGGRIVIGLAAVIAGVVLLISAGSVLAVVLESLLIVAGLDLVVTGALGHCPLYQRLGHMPASLAGRHD